ncbi:MAG: DNA primase [Deltaproteobacteria bacterium]|nr:DNA primase [Deltaproteobacteria bacterium]
MTSYSFPPEFVSDLRARTNIVEVVGDYVSLTRAGVNYKGLCPFHGEKTPSFMVHPGKGIFHCFGCGVGGDAITFIKKIENLSYPETLLRLARRAGIDVTPYERRQGSLEAQAKARSERENLTRAVAAAQEFFVQRLRENLNGKVGAYLEKRGISPAQAESFGLGFAPDSWSGLKDELRRRGIPEAHAVAAGLLVRKEESGRTYDRFRDRLMFPIHDVSGVVVGFGGRILGEGEPKYLNSPESAIFNKRRLLYDLHHARPAIARQGCAFLVEGYMDALALYLRGIDNVVATLGTALSPENVQAVKRYTGRVAVFFDNDRAGRAAAFRALPLFMAAGIMPDIVTLPEGVKDPDELAAGLDDAGLREALERQTPLFDLFLHQRGAGLENYNDRLAFLREVIAMILLVPDRALRGLALRTTSETLRLAEEIVLDEYRRLRKRSNRRFGNAAGPGSAAEAKSADPAASMSLQPEEIILATLIDYPELVPEVEKEFLVRARNQPCLSLFRELAAIGKDCSDPGSALLGRLAEHDDNEALSALYARLVNLAVGVEDLETARRTINDCLFSLERRDSREQSRSLDQELSQCRDEERMFELLRRKMELKKKLLAS